MKTRCPAWCDRVLMSQDAKEKVVVQENGQDSQNGSEEDHCKYNVIGSDTCMGDHKPVYLSFKMRLAS